MDCESEPFQQHAPPAGWRNPAQHRTSCSTWWWLWPDWVFAGLWQLPALLVAIACCRKSFKVSFLSWNGGNQLVFHICPFAERDRDKQTRDKRSNNFPLLQDKLIWCLLPKEAKYQWCFSSEEYTQLAKKIINCAEKAKGKFSTGH